VAHKFRVGDVVEYKAAGSKARVFRVVRQMPEEFQAYDWKYRIKSDQEGFERNVLECDLRECDTPSIVPEAECEAVTPSRRTGTHH
jgi:hypothetical protein